MLKTCKSTWTRWLRGLSLCQPKAKNEVKEKEIGKRPMFSHSPNSKDSYIYTRAEFDKHKQKCIQHGALIILSEGIRDGTRQLINRDTGKEAPVDIKTMSSTGNGGLISIPPSPGKSWIIPPIVNAMLDIPREFIDLYKKNHKDANKAVVAKSIATKESTKPPKYDHGDDNVHYATEVYFYDTKDSLIARLFFFLHPGKATYTYSPMIVETSTRDIGSAVYDVITCRQRLAACRIQRAWLRAKYNPNYNLCKRLLVRDMDTIMGVCEGKDCKKKLSNRAIGPIVLSDNSQNQKGNLAYISRINYKKKIDKNCGLSFHGDTG